MIYSKFDTEMTITWQPEQRPDAGEIARKFLAGEHELWKLVRVRSSDIAALNAFLARASVSPVMVATAGTGDLLVRASHSDEVLVVTGKTADVLRSYINEEPVSTQDRADMTMRRRIDMRACPSLSSAAQDSVS